MGGRPPLAIGAHGKIRYQDITKPGGPKNFRALCQYRDLDGRTRQVEAAGPTRPAAERELKARLATRSASTADDITPDTRIRVAAERWYTTIVAAVDDGERSPSTGAQYRGLLDRHVLPAVGELRLREATTGRLDAVLTRIKTKSGAPTAKAARTVLSGILGWAARQDAVPTNATRNTSAIPTKPRKQPRALSVEECARWLQRLTGDPAAVRHDLIDLTGFMLGTGVRIGEGLALQWEDVDLIGTKMVVDGTVRLVCTARVDWTLIRVTGKGLIRKSVKTSAGERTLRLPEFLVTMLRRRAVEMYVLATGALPPGDFEYPAPRAVSAGQAPPAGDSVHFEDMGSPDQTVSRRPLTSTNRSSGDIEDIEYVLRESTVTAALAHLAGTPVFPDTRGGYRDPSNTRRDIRDARGEEFSWVTSHVYRKTAATMLDEAGLTARQIANQLGHARPSLTQDVYMARGVADPLAARAFEQGLGKVFGMDKAWTDQDNQGRGLA